MLTALANATVFTGREKLTEKTVIIEDGKISAIADPGSVPPEAHMIDCKDKFIAPGLIDLQIAGGGGYLFSSSPSAEALMAISDSIVRTGTTGFLIAIPTNTFDVYRKVIKTVKENPLSPVLGLHFEGPYISLQRRGAHIPACIKTPDRNELESLLAEADGVIKMMTVAPEICTEEIIGCLRRNGVVAAAGHSNATFREAMQGFSWGIQTTTHLFNAMSQLHHRDPGLPGAAFVAKNVFASIIADGIHVDYNMVSIARKLMGERLFLISDAVEESSDGATMHRRQKDRFTLPDGTLSGSILSMMTAVKNVIASAGISPDEALRMASTYPARLMNLNDRGKIEPGLRADLVIFDKDYEVSQVLSEGKLFVD